MHSKKKVVSRIRIMRQEEGHSADVPAFAVCAVGIQKGERKEGAREKTHALSEIVTEQVLEKDVFAHRHVWHTSLQSTTVHN